MSVHFILLDIIILVKIPNHEAHQSVIFSILLLLLPHQLLMFSSAPCSLTVTLFRETKNVYKHSSPRLAYVSENLISSTEFCFFCNGNKRDGFVNGTKICILKC
jgi:hypothetical protein